MATYRIGVSRAGVQPITLDVRYGDDVSFVIDRSDPPPASASLQVVSLTPNVKADALFDESSIRLPGNVTPRVRSRPEAGSTYHFEVSGDWSEAGAILVPTTGKINVGSGG